MPNPDIKVLCSHCGAKQFFSKEHYQTKVSCGNCHTSFYLPQPFGPFLLHALIANDEYSTTHWAEEKQSGQFYRLRRIRKKYVEDESLVGLFKARVKAQQASPISGVAKIEAYGFVDQVFFYVVEGAPKRSLKKALAKVRLPVKEVLSLALALTEILKRSGEKGLLHGRLRSSQVFFRDNDTVFIDDFSVSSEIDRHLYLSPSNQSLPCSSYTAPEVLRAKKACKASDIYALGALIYEMLASLPLFDEKKGKDLVKAQFSETPIDIRQVSPTLSKNFSLFLNTMLAKKEEQRPSSYDEILEHLRTEYQKEIGVRVESVKSILEKDKSSQTLFGFDASQQLDLDDLSEAVHKLEVINFERPKPYVDMIFCALSVLSAITAFCLL